MNEPKNYAIGVDLGGTNTVFGIVDAQGNIVAQDSIKTQAYSTAEAFVEAGVACLQPLINQLLQRRHRDCPQHRLGTRHRRTPRPDVLGKTVNANR